MLGRSKSHKMQEVSEKHLKNDAARNSYLEFNFCDGVMVDCSDKNNLWNPSSTFNDNMLIATGAVLDTVRQTNMGTDSDWTSILTEACQERNLKNSAFPNMKQRRSQNIDSLSRKPCMSALGIHMCDCEEGSMYCNLATCMTSPSDGKKSKFNRAPQEKVLPEESDHASKKHHHYGRPGTPSSSSKSYVHNEGALASEFCSTSAKKSKFNRAPQEKVVPEESDHASKKHHHYGRLGTPSSSSKSYVHNERALASEFCSTSSITAWATVVSDSPSCSSKLMTGSSATERVPTLASHLELTQSALTQGKLCSIYEEDMELAAQHTASGQDLSVIASTLRTQFAGLKLDVGSLSVSEPAPYGTLHGVLHCTLKGGLPNYTLLLDDYDEVLTAKIWCDNMTAGHFHETCKYSIYTLREEKKRKGKSGWKNWRSKDKLHATLVGKMKVSSVLCTKEKHKLSVKSRGILFSARLNESTVAEEAKVCFQEAHSPLPETEAHYCGNADLNVHGLTGMATVSASLMGLSPACALWQSSSPTKHRSRETTTATSTTQNCCANSAIQKISSNANAQAFLLEELAAMLIDVPLQVQERRVTTKEASITIILPSGNHGRPSCDLKGPSPLIRRWKEGGKCDCKGWDLGCGLMVLSNSRKKAKMGGDSESCKMQRPEGEDQSRSLRLYKQDKDQEEVFFSLAPQTNGLLALDFRAPLSPLQAFSIAVATLHGRETRVPPLKPRVPPLKPPTLCTATSFSNGTFANKKDEWLVEKANIKSQALQAIDSKLQKSWQPQGVIDNSHVKGHASELALGKVHASELALSFERV